MRLQIPYQRESRDLDDDMSYRYEAIISLILVYLPWNFGVRSTFGMETVWQVEFMAGAAEIVCGL